MNKLLFALAAIVLAVLASMAFRKSDAEVIAEASQELRASCMRQGAATPLLPPDRLEAFCECSAQKVVQDFGADGLRELLANPQDAAFDQEKLGQLSIECFDEVVASIAPLTPRAAPSSTGNVSESVAVPVQPAGNLQGAKQATGGRSGD